MKKILSLTILILILYPTIALAGCFPRKDIDSTVKVTPDFPCLIIKSYSGCVGFVVLSIDNNCKEPFIYEKDGKKHELYSHEEWNKIKHENPIATVIFYDRDIPQTYTTWTRQLYLKSDPSIIVTIEGENYHVKRPFEIDKAYVGVAAIIIVLGIFVYVIKISFFKKKQVSTKK